MNELSCGDEYYWADDLTGSFFWGGGKCRKKIAPRLEAAKGLSDFFLLSAGAEESRLSARALRSLSNLSRITATWGKSRLVFGVVT